MPLSRINTDNARQQAVGNAAEMRRKTQADRVAQEDRRTQERNQVQQNAQQARKPGRTEVNVTA